MSTSVNQCNFQRKKNYIDEVFSQLDDYYFELKDKLIYLINENYFEDEIKIFLVKIFKLDDKDDSGFNLISFIELIKGFSDELFQSHRISCQSNEIDKLHTQIGKLNDQIKRLQEDNEKYKKKFEKISNEIKQSKGNKIEFENLNINYNTPSHVFNNDGILQSILSEKYPNFRSVSKESGNMRSSYYKNGQTKGDRSSDRNRYSPYLKNSKVFQSRDPSGGRGNNPNIHVSMKKLIPSQQVNQNSSSTNRSGLNSRSSNNTIINNTTGKNTKVKILN